MDFNDINMLALERAAETGKVDFKVVTDLLAKSRTPNLGLIRDLLVRSLEIPELRTVLCSAPKTILLKALRTDYLYLLPNDELTDRLFQALRISSPESKLQKKLEAFLTTSEIILSRFDDHDILVDLALEAIRRKRWLSSDHLFLFQNDHKAAYEAYELAYKFKTRIKNRIEYLSDHLLLSGVPGEPLDVNAVCRTLVINTRTPVEAVLKSEKIRNHLFENFWTYHQRDPRHLQRINKCMNSYGLKLYGKPSRYFLESAQVSTKELSKLEHIMYNLDKVSLEHVNLTDLLQLVTSEGALKLYAADPQLVFSKDPVRRTEAFKVKLRKILQEQGITYLKI